MDLNAIAKLADSIWNGRDSFNEGFEELARYVYPQARGFESQANKGAEDREYIWDSTPEEAALTLSAALGSLLTTPSGNWFALDLQGEDAPGGESGRWLTDVARAMLDAFNAPNSLFYQELNTFYMDLSVLAWAVLYSEYRDGEGLSFRAISPNQCALAEDARGRVDTVVRRYEQSAGQLAEEFTPESLPESVKEALKNDSQKLFKVNHIVLPRAKMPQEAKTEDMGGGGEKSPGDNGPHEFVSIVYIDKAEKPLSQKGFYELPYVCPRWSKRAGEVYGRGCGHAALPDIRVLNRVSLSQLDAAEKASNPPLLVPDDAVIDRRINTYPGGITYWRPSGGEIAPLPIAANLEAMQVIRLERQESIRRLFLNDRIQLQGGPQMTATEILARERKQTLVLGPVLGRLQTEFLGPLISRVFGLLYRAGQLPDAPQALAGREIAVRYVSPIARAQKQGEAESFNNAFMYASPLIQISPQLMDNFDQDAIVRDTQEIFGYPEKYLKDERTVAGERQQKQEAAQQQAAMQLAAQAAQSGGAGPSGTGMMPGGGL